MIKRSSLHKLLGLLDRHSVVGLLGPRQVGKSTLAREIGRTRPSVYLDLESPSDRAKLAEPELYLEAHADKLVILDEIHRLPGLFEVLRGCVDRGRERGRPFGQFLVLGSASIDLLKQSSETLAGRIYYLELPGLDLLEVAVVQPDASDRLWIRGGFPSSFLAGDEAASFEWRQAFVQTYLQRDIPALGPRIPAETLRRFWTMLAHTQGSILNAAAFATSLGISGQTVARYLDLLVDLLLVRRLPPWTANAGKRLVKSPKVYIRDSGIVHSLLNLRTRDEVLGHPVAGFSWEGHVLENILASTPPGTESYFYRTAAGAEVDLLLRFPGGRLWAVEIKRSLAPSTSRGFHHAVADLQPEARHLVYPGVDRFTLPGGTIVTGLADIMRLCQGM